LYAEAIDSGEWQKGSLQKVLMCDLAIKNRGQTFLVGTPVDDSGTSIVGGRWKSGESCEAAGDEPAPDDD